MPAVSAGTCDPIEVTLRSSLEGAGSGNYLDDQIISTAKRVLLTKIDYHPAEKEYSSPLKSLQSKYIHLNSNLERPDGPLNHKDDNHGTSSVKSSREECKLDADGIPIPRIVIHPPDNIKLGWLRVYKIGAGLANLGNTCFLNATLQCLTYTPPLVNHLIEFNEHSSTCKNVGFCMMCELQRHIRRALEKNGEIIRPQCILHKLKSIAAHMSWGRQEDAHEFLHYMMESMISSSLNGYSTAKLDRISYETTVVNQIFGGYHRSQVICLRCKEKSDTYDHFMDVMLDIKNVPSLEKALEHFVQPEILDNENAYMCPKCKQKCPAKKRFTIHRAPNIITFQLKRFDYSRSMGGKITKHVSFPEKFDMRAYMSQRQGPPIVYLLYAVLVHQGVSCNSGHYFCFVRNSNNLWYLMDDSKVRQVSVNFVLSQQAYLLFYTRIPHNGQMLKSPLQLPSVNNRMPFLPASSASGSATNTNGNSSSITNGVTAKSVSDSFGVPLMRKSNPLMSNNVVKPKSALSNVISTAIPVKSSLVHTSGSGPPLSSSSVLPSNREKITFDFKLTNCHQNSTSKLSLPPASSSGGSGGGNVTPAVRNCSSNSGNSDTGQQPKHPRIVMQIKNGKVYNYHQQTSLSSSSSATKSLSCGSTTSPTVSCLVPYAPDSSEESDQDSSRTGNHAKSLGRGSGKVNSKCVLEQRDWSSGRVKLDPQLNATTELPGLPKPKSADDKEVESKDGGHSQSSTPGSSAAKKPAPVSDGQLMVLTNCSVANSKINATSPWLVMDSSQQSPSLASEGSNTSVNSTSEWTVLDDKDLNATKVDRQQFPKWTVPTGDGGSGVSGVGTPPGAKKSLCERTRESKIVRQNSVTNQAGSVGSGKELKDVLSSVAAKGGGDGLSILRQSLSSSLSVQSHSAGSPSEYKWTNGAVEDEGLPEGHVRKRLLSHLDSVDHEGSHGIGRQEEEADRRLSPVVNGTEGCSSESLDDQSGRHRKKKRKHKKDRESGLSDDSAKWRNRSGHRKDGSVPNGKDDDYAMSPSKRRKRHSSGGGGGNSSSTSSSDGYELEWVEKTKETLEEVAKDADRREEGEAKTCAVSLDGDIKSEGYDKVQQCNGTVSTRNGDSSFEGNFGPNVSGDADTGTDSVAELLKKGGRGYGEGVNTWDGNRSVVNRDAEQGSGLSWRGKYDDDYNEDYDRGKVKKVKNKWRHLNSSPVSNPFQRMQDLKASGNYFKPNRWHSSAPAPYWDDHNHHRHHPNNNHHHQRHHHNSQRGSMRKRPPPQQQQQYHGNRGYYFHPIYLTAEEQKLLADIRRRKVELMQEIKQLKDEIAEVTAEMESMESIDESKNNQKSKQMSIGRKKFNMDPKKGIEYLIEHNLLKDTAEDIAQFLYKGEGLNKTAIGDYLGERHDFNQKVLNAFVELHDFSDLILVQALRQFLWSFRLPGESQKIDRMMECFAQRYCQLNPGVFTSTDTCYVLSFAIIMLNTSLHNPSVKEKPSVEQFIAMNRGINDGGDLPEELLQSLYESIKREPFKIPEDDGNDLMHTFFNPDREGWLWKQGGRYKSWKRRWFILNDNCLYYFEYTTDKEPRGIIPLENIQVRDVHDRSKANCFELYASGSDVIKACKTDSEGKVVEGKHTVYRMSAATLEDKEDWMRCIRQSISENPFYDMLASRKKKAQKKHSHHHQGSTRP